MRITREPLRSSPMPGVEDDRVFAMFRKGCLGYTCLAVIALVSSFTFLFSIISAAFFLPDLVGRVKKYEHPLKYTLIIIPLTVAFCAFYVIKRCFEELRICRIKYKVENAKIEFRKAVAKQIFNHCGHVPTVRLEDQKSLQDLLKESKDSVFQYENKKGCKGILIKCVHLESWKNCFSTNPFFLAIEQQSPETKMDNKIEWLWYEINSKVSFGCKSRECMKRSIKKIFQLRDERFFLFSKLTAAEVKKTISRFIEIPRLEERIDSNPATITNSTFGKCGETCDIFEFTDTDGFYCIAMKLCAINNGEFFYDNEGRVVLVFKRLPDNQWQYNLDKKIDDLAQVRVLETFAVLPMINKIMIGSHMSLSFFPDLSLGVNYSQRAEKKLEELVGGKEVYDKIPKVPEEQKLDTFLDQYSLTCFDWKFIPSEFFEEQLNVGYKYDIWKGKNKRVFPFLMVSAHEFKGRVGKWNESIECSKENQFFALLFSNPNCLFPIANETHEFRAESDRGISDDILWKVSFSKLLSKKVRIGGSLIRDFFGIFQIILRGFTDVIGRGEKRSQRLWCVHPDRFYSEIAGCKIPERKRESPEKKLKRVKEKKTYLKMPKKPFLRKVKGGALVYSGNFRKKD